MSRGATRRLIVNSTRLEEPHVSFSQINTYLGCPLKYRFAYIEQLPPEFVPSALPFGGGLHEAFAEYYRNLKISQKLSHDDLVDVFKANWDLKNQCERILFDEGEDKDSMFELALNMLRVFYENVQPGEPLAIEQEFTLRKCDNNGGKLLPLPLVGSIDLIERTQDGRIVCVDHKSAARKYAENKAHDDLQLSIYTAAIARSSLVSPQDKEFHCRLDVLTKTTKPNFIRYDAATGLKVSKFDR